MSWERAAQKRWKGEKGEEVEGRAERSMGLVAEGQRSWGGLSPATNSLLFSVLCHSLIYHLSMFVPWCFLTGSK